VYSQAASIFRFITTVKVINSKFSMIGRMNGHSIPAPLQELFGITFVITTRNIFPLKGLDRNLLKDGNIM
jgi:hypothetical protein